MASNAGTVNDRFDFAQGTAASLRSLSLTRRRCARQAVILLFTIHLAAKNHKHSETAMGIRSHTTATKAALALGIFLTPPGNLSFPSPAMGQPIALAKRQSDAFNTYNNALSRFKSILGERRGQINSNQRLPNLPGQALYLARINIMSAYKDLTDALPSKIGRPNKFGIPPEYFDADNEPLVDEYRKLFDIMEAPPVNAQNSATPFKDVVDLGIAIARAKGLDETNAEAAGRISLGLFFAETNGNQNIGNARSNRYKGSLQTGPSEDQNGRKKWEAIKKLITAFDPELSARDDKEEARVGDLDHRLNHWTAVRDALMSAHADLFPQIPVIVKTLPNPIDQMKLSAWIPKTAHPACQFPPSWPPKNPPLIGCDPWVPPSRGRTAGFCIWAAIAASVAS